MHRDTPAHVLPRARKAFALARLLLVGVGAAASVLSIFAWHARAPGWQAASAALGAGLAVLGVTLHWLRARVRGLIAVMLRNEEEHRRQAAELELHVAEINFQSADILEASRLLAESEERYRRMIERTPYGTLVHCDGTIVFANAAAVQLLGGAAPADLLGRAIRDLVHPKSLASVEERIARVLGGDASVPLVEQTLLRIDGGSVDVESAGILFNHEGRDAVQLVFHDVGERKRLEEQFRQAQKMEAVGQLAGGIAHDFNNLLTVIASYSAALLMETPPDAPCRADVEEIGRAAHRAGTLTRQLLAFSRQQVLQPRVVDLNAIARDMEKLLRRLLREDVRFVTTLAPSLGRVYADPGQIEQVIMNLVVNARDAMPLGGTLTIATADVDADEAGADDLRDGGGRSRGWVCLSVTDTGCGMDDGTRERLFEPFFTTKEVGKGTGLGLSTAYGIVAQSGGRMRVTSERGRGSTFSVLLPRVGSGAAADDAPEADAGADTPTLRAGSETILLVEDEPAVRMVARRILERAGYTVIEAGDGVEALRLFDERGASDGNGRDGVQLVVTDMVMPEMGGDELARAIRARSAATPILFMSGHTDDVAARQQLAAPGSVFLHKPFGPEALTAKVREALDER
jgi:PAS domain S-box-containing protein